MKKNLQNQKFLSTISFIMVLVVLLTAGSGTSYAKSLTPSRGTSNTPKSTLPSTSKYETLAQYSLIDGLPINKGMYLPFSANVQDIIKIEEALKYRSPDDPINKSSKDEYSKFTTKCNDWNDPLDCYAHFPDSDRIEEDKHRAIDFVNIEGKTFTVFSGVYGKIDQINSVPETPWYANVIIRTRFSGRSEVAFVVYSHIVINPQVYDWKSSGKIIQPNDILGETYKGGLAENPDSIWGGVIEVDGVKDVSGYCRPENGDGPHPFPGDKNYRCYPSHLDFKIKFDTDGDNEFDELHSVDNVVDPFGICLDPVTLAVEDGCQAYYYPMNRFNNNKTNGRTNFWITDRYNQPLAVPMGDILTPSTNSLLSPDSDGFISVQASANDGGSGNGIKEVSIWAQYDGEWHLAGKTDQIVNGIYTIRWYPGCISPQDIRLGVHVEGNDGSYYVEPEDLTTLVRGDDRICADARIPLIVPIRLTNYKWLISDGYNSDGHGPDNNKADLMAFDITGNNGTVNVAGADVIAAANGTVWGKSTCRLVIRHDNNIFTTYLHVITENHWEKGDPIRQGELIGRLAAQQNPPAGQRNEPPYDSDCMTMTGPHLHFMLNKWIADGEPMDTTLPYNINNYKSWSPYSPWYPLPFMNLGGKSYPFKGTEKYQYQDRSALSPLLPICNPSTQSFCDVFQTDKFFPYIDAMVKLRTPPVTDGCRQYDPDNNSGTNNTLKYFCPEDYILRGQAMAFLGRAFGTSDPDQGLFHLALAYRTELQAGALSTGFRNEFKNQGVTLSDSLAINKITDNQKWEIVEIVDGGKTFLLTAEVDKLKVELKSPYADMPDDSPSKFHNWVKYFTAIGIVSGYSDGNFYQDLPITRGQWAKMIVGTLKWKGITCSLAHETEFQSAITDIHPGDTFYTDVWCLWEIMKAKGFNKTVTQPNGSSLITPDMGYSDGTIRAAENITRAQSSKWLDFAMGLTPAKAQDLTGTGAPGSTTAQITPTNSSTGTGAVNMASQDMFAQSSSAVINEVSLVTPGDNWDWVKVNIPTLEVDPAKNLVTFKTTENGLNADIKLEIYDSNATTLLASSVGYAKNGGTILTWTPTHTGTFYLKTTNVFEYGLEGSDYILRAENKGNNACASPNTTFCDVPVNHPRYAAIETAYQKGWISGVQVTIDGIQRRFFNPSDSLLRQHGVVIVSHWMYGHNASNYTSILPPMTGIFPDVGGDGETVRAVEMGYREGMTSGFSDGTFKPVDPATRSNFIYFVMRALLKHAAVTSAQCTFSDTTDLVIRKACDLGLVNGVTVNGQKMFYPEDPMPRELAALVACRAFSATYNNGLPNECGDTVAVSAELLSLRANARQPHNSSYLCFTAPLSANGKIPGVSVTSEGMLLNYQYGNPGSYKTGCGMTTTGTAAYIYKANTTSYACGSGSVAMKFTPDNVNHRIKVEVSKCDLTPFVSGGTIEIWMDSTGDGLIDPLVDERIKLSSYSAGELSYISYIDPVLKGFYGPHYFRSTLYSSNDPNTPKYTGTLTAWEEYQTPSIAHNQTYLVSPDTYTCGSYIKGKLRVNSGLSDLAVYIGKCDDSSFVYGGKAYVYVDGVPRWGPFPYTYSPNTGGYNLGDIDPVSLGITGQHTYKIMVYSDDLPTNQGKYSGNIQISNFEIPAAPQNVQASDSVYTDQILVSWDDSAYSYQVWRATTSSSSTAVNISGITTNSVYADRTATVGMLYYYWVKACTDTGICGPLSSYNTGSVKLAVSTPVNDNFDNATVISGVPFNTSQSIVNATSDFDDPSFTCVTGKKYNTVWYKITPSSSGYLTLDTAGSGYDTVLALWSGSRGNLQSKACNDNNNGNASSRIQANVTAGTTYYIEVAGYSALDVNTLSLNVSLDTPPVITKIETKSPNPTSADTVEFLVTVSEPVTGVDINDFQTYGLGGSHVTGVTGSGAAYTVTVNTGTSFGSLRLNVINNGSIKDSGNLALTGINPEDEFFPGGEFYTISPTLIVNIDGGGSGTITSYPNGISCGSACSSIFAYGTTVTITAIPATDQVFTGWSAGWCSGTNTCTISMDSDQTITATFKAKQTLTISKSGTGSGTVTSSPSGIDCGAICAYNFIYNTVVTLTASPSAGSIFTGWSGGVCSGNGPCVVTMDTTQLTTANFQIAPIPPLDFVKTSPANNSVNQLVSPMLSWENSINAVSYQYCIDTIDDNSCNTSWVPTSSLSVSSAQLMANTIYYWQVKALNAYGETNADAGIWWNFKTENIIKVTLMSTGVQDGWVLESSETSNLGGKVDYAGTTFNVGDDATKKQYRGILSFNTGPGLPDNAVITKVTLKIKKQGMLGIGDPFTLFQGMLVDMKLGFFGTAASLATSDFQLAAGKSFGPFKPVPANGWYSFDLTPGKAIVNKLANGSGLTQIRLRFKLDDNNNTVANYVKFYSGNYGTASLRPQLIIEYYVP